MSSAGRCKLSVTWKRCQLKKVSSKESCHVKEVSRAVSGG